MSFEAYLNAIRLKTGKDPHEFRLLAAARGLAGSGLRAGEVVAWLKEDFGLGRGHAMAVYALLKSADRPPAGVEDRLDRLFAGARSRWRRPFDGLLDMVREFGPDIGIAPTGTYVSLLRTSRKFAIVQPAAGHMDIGIRRKGVAPASRMAAAGDWNRMVTHRLRISAGEPVDAEVLDWLRLAYLSAG